MRAGYSALSAHRVRDRYRLSLGEPEQRFIRRREMNAAANEDERPLGVSKQSGGAADVRAVRPHAPRRHAQRRRVDHKILGGKFMLAVTNILRHVEQNGSRPARGRDREGPPQEFGNAARLLHPDQLLDRRPQNFDLAAFLGHVLPGVSAVGVAGKRDDRRSGVQRLDQAGHQVGGARPERAVTYSRPIGDPRIGFGRKGAAALVVDQEMLHAELSQRVIERQELEAAHAEHGPGPGEPQHLGHGAAAVHAAGGTVARLAGVAHACFSRSAAARRTMATNSRALMPGAAPSAAAQELTRDKIPSS